MERFYLAESGEFFEWAGKFEQFQARWKSKSSRDEVELTKGNYVLWISYSQKGKNPAEGYIPYLPDEVSLNSKHFGRYALAYENKERILIEEQLKNFYEHGRPINFKSFSPKTNETLEILIFGYFTYKRFIHFLETHFPEFLGEIRNYTGKPVMEILDVFKSTNLSLEELELELKNAVSREDFERASFLRDKIHKLRGKS